jgi:hypothetical protein
MNERYRLPLVAAVALVAVVVVVAAIVGLGSLGSSTTSPDSTRLPPAPPTTQTATPTPADSPSTPESATRAFFHAYSVARKTDDPSLVEPYVASKESGAYQSVEAFLGGELAVNRASVVTVERLDNMTSSVAGDTATVDFDYTEGGYDINPSTGAAQDTPAVLAPYHVTVTLKLVGGHWLVDSYVSHQ